MRTFAAAAQQVLDDTFRHTLRVDLDVDIPDAVDSLTAAHEAHADRVSVAVRDWADRLVKRPDRTLIAADVVWQLRQILSNPNVGIADASVVSGAPVTLRGTSRGTGEGGDAQ